MRRTVLVFAAALLALPAFAWRLPQDVVPSNYKLRFVPDLEAEKFSGEERISIRVLKPTSSVKLNAADIEFDEVLIASGGESQKATVTYDADIEIATLTVDKALAAGPASIAIRFRGILNDKLRGFYISHSPRRKYAVTQMEPTDARRAFPSFDEPAFKATYDITIVVDDGDTAISNAKIVSDVPGPVAGKHTITFERTAKMSTYLVAMLVGDWKCSEGGVDGIPIRVCATPENADLTKWGLVSAEAELKYFNQYYDFKYPFGKLDIIALPDFEAGAMENAGAITFREASLLVDEKSGSALHLRQVAQTNAHEIAHMWFGDVVTMQWWDDIWLNEGFATWITNKPINAWKPEWDLRVEEATNTSRSLTVDAMESTRPIRNRADTPAEINQMFDGIDPNAVDATLLEQVAPLAALKGDAALLRKFKAAMAASKSPGEYYRNLYALISFEDPALAKEAYVAALSADMRSQDLPGFIEAMFQKPERRTEAWAFVKNNWDELNKKFTAWGGAAIVGSTGSLCNAKQREDVQQFFATHPVEASDRSLKQALEKIDSCVELRTLQAQNFAYWINSEAGSK